MNYLALIFAVTAALGHWGAVRAQAPSQTALPVPEIYTCMDASGRKLTSDRPIAACRDREQRILNPSGTVKERVGPTLTANEQAQLQARERAERAEQARQEEERRQDRALLMRYRDPDAHQKVRQEALDNINRSKQTALRRSSELLAQRTELSNEMAFYEKDPSKAPPQLQHQLQRVDQALAVQGRLLAEFDAQIRRINERFDAELKRLQALWSARSSRTH